MRRGTAQQRAEAPRCLHEKDSTIIFVRMADGVRFVLNDQPVEVSDVSPMTTLLDWLRDHRGLKGTKEGCAEGDCGACTVVLERADGRREAMNACIALLGQIDGQSVRTVEGLRRPDGGPHRGADGDGRGRRHAMRLLHAGLRDVGLCLCRGRRDGRSRDHPRCAGRQSLPLHRLSADRRGHDEGRRTADRAGAAGAGADGVGDFRRRLSCAALARRTPGAARAESRGAAAGGRHRSRPSGQPRAQAAGRDHPCGARARAQGDRRDQGGDHDRRRRDLRRGHAAADRPLPGAQNLSGAAGLAADPHHGHDRRQYRHGLADRRHAAGAAGARDAGSSSFPRAARAT